MEVRESLFSSNFLFIGLKFRHVPSYLANVRVGGKIQEFIHNLIHSDHCPTAKVVATHCNLLIIGGMSHIGARLGYKHYEYNKSVIVTEDIINVNRINIKWYRWSKLSTLLQPFIYSYHSKESVTAVLMKHSPKHLAYIPTGLYDIKTDDKLWTSSSYYKIINNVLSMLESVKMMNTPMIVVLPNNVNGRWSRILNRTIQSYTSVNNLDHRITVISTDVLYGPWEDYEEVVESKYRSKVNYVDNVAIRIMNTLYKDEIRSMISVKESKYITKLWINEFRNEQKLMNKKDLVSGATLMFNYCYHCFFYSSDYDYIKDWFLSAVKYDLDILLIHSSFSDELQSKLKLAHNKTRFLQSDCVNTKAATDQRFYILYEYLLNHSEINRIVFTDQRDVRFLNDPFKIMDGIGNDLLYVGHDDDRCINSVDDSFIRKQLKSCFPKYSGTIIEKELLGLSGCFNSGVLGGSRLTMLTLLAHMIVIFQSTNYRVCDMIAVGLPAHTDLYDIVFTLYPFNNGFDSKTEGPFGLAVKHKISMY